MPYYPVPIGKSQQHFLKKFRPGEKRRRITQQNITMCNYMQKSITASILLLRLLISSVRISIPA